jgi:MFS family permease
MNHSTAVPNTPPAGSLAYGWLTVGLLTIAYVFSFVDRYVLGLLIEPIKADLGLTDTQIGLLLGPAFAIFYATMGLPLGWLADKKNRVRIVAIGIAVWSIATAASGLARNFTHLFIARMSIGVGEATLSPCAMSIISDSFPSPFTPWRFRWAQVLRRYSGQAFSRGQNRAGPSQCLWSVNSCLGRPRFLLWVYRVLLCRRCFFYCVSLPALRESIPWGATCQTC